MYYIVCRGLWGTKEGVDLVLNAIKDKYFDKGLRDHLSEDYEPVGMIMGKDNNVTATL